MLSRFPLTSDCRLQVILHCTTLQVLILIVRLEVCFSFHCFSKTFHPSLVYQEPLQEALQYLILISEVEETEIFKICLDYWNVLAAELYRETPNPGAGQSPLLLMGGLMSGAMRQMEMSPRRALYNPTLSKVLVYYSAE